MESSNLIKTAQQRLNQRAALLVAEQKKLLSSRLAADLELSRQLTKARESLFTPILKAGEIDSQLPSGQIKELEKILKKRREESSRLQKQDVFRMEEDRKKIIASNSKKIGRYKAPLDNEKTFIILTMADDFYMTDPAGVDNSFVGQIRHSNDHHLGSATNELCNNWFRYEVCVKMDANSPAYFIEVRRFSLHFYYIHQGTRCFIEPSAYVLPAGYYGMNLFGSEFSLWPDAVIRDVFGLSYANFGFIVSGWICVQVLTPTDESYDHCGNTDNWLDKETSFGLNGNLIAVSSDHVPFGGEERILTMADRPIVYEGDTVIASLCTQTVFFIHGNESPSARLFVDVTVPSISLVATKY